MDLNAEHVNKTFAAQLDMTMLLMDVHQWMSVYMLLLGECNGPNIPYSVGERHKQTPLHTV